MKLLARFRALPLLMVARYGRLLNLAWTARDSAFHAELGNNSFEVYEVSEIDQIQTNLQNQITSVVADKGIIDTRIKASEERLNEQVVKSINGISQRILSEEAAKILKQTVLTELREELQQLRRDMQLRLMNLRRILKD